MKRKIIIEYEVDFSDSFSKANIIDVARNIAEFGLDAPSYFDSEEILFTGGLNTLESPKITIEGIGSVNLE